LLNARKEKVFMEWCLIKYMIIVVVVVVVVVVVLVAVFYFREELVT
jgi:hypothetical protein